MVLLFIQLLYPRLTALMTGMNRPATLQEQLQAEYGDFDPTAPITIVPNDYVEEE